MELQGTRSVARARGKKEPFRAHNFNSPRGYHIVDLQDVTCAPGYGYIWLVLQDVPSMRFVLQNVPRMWLVLQDVAGASGPVFQI